MISADALPCPSPMAGLPHDIRNPNPELQEQQGQEHQQQQWQEPALNKKRKLPGTPDPDAEVIALSPATLTATNRFVCDVCDKGFQREQNLQLHRRGHNLPWNLKRRTGEASRKRVYVCPETTCVHHHPSRALGDLTGIKKHFSRKHGEKKWKCDRCSKKYAVKSDWNAHVKICGTCEYRCDDCGTVFSRKDSFTSHKAVCDPSTEESESTLSCSIATAAASASGGDLGFIINSNTHSLTADGNPHLGFGHDLLPASGMIPQLPHHTIPAGLISYEPGPAAYMGLPQLLQMGSGEYSSGISSHLTEYGECSALQQTGHEVLSLPNSSAYGLERDKAQHLLEHYSQNENAAHLSAMALLQKAAQMAAPTSNYNPSFSSSSSSSSSFLGGFGGLISSPRSFNYDLECKNVLQQSIDLQGRQPAADTFLLPGELLGSEEKPPAPMASAGAGEMMMRMMMSSSGHGQKTVVISEETKPPAMASTGGDQMTMMMSASGDHDQEFVVSEETKPCRPYDQTGPTRDFLGLRGDETAPPLLKQELDSFASMVTGMDVISASYDAAR